MSTIALHSTLNISETVRDRGLVQMDHQQEMAWAIKGQCDRWRHVTLKGQTRDHNTLRAQYLENGWIERHRSKGPPIGNGMWVIKWSRDRWRHGTPKGLVRQYGRLWRQRNLRQINARNTVLKSTLGIQLCRYLYSFSCCCLINLRNFTKLSENSNL